MSDIGAKIDKVKRELLDGVEKSLVDQAEAMLVRARELAPEKTGRLKASMKNVPIEDGSRLEVGVPYAADVHENPSSTGHKFLENAVKELSAGFADRVADGVKRG